MELSEIILNGGVEAITLIVLSLVVFFVKRTLAQYDQRINEIEHKHNEAVTLLHKIDKEITRLSTILSMLVKPSDHQ